ncbi:hypothetical protein GCM10027568_03270 [Humibacter soli]
MEVAFSGFENVTVGSAPFAPPTLTASETEPDLGAAHAAEAGFDEDDGVELLPEPELAHPASSRVAAETARMAVIFVRTTKLSEGERGITSVCTTRLCRRWEPCPLRILTADS